MDVSVVIVNYNVKHFLEQVVLSVQKASKNLAVEILIVDNNSVDGSIEMMEYKQKLILSMMFHPERKSISQNKVDLIFKNFFKI